MTATARHPLSAREQAVLDYVREVAASGHASPSIREICRACGISSTSVASYYLDQLERHGYLHRTPELARGLRLVEQLRPVPGCGCDTCWDAGCQCCRGVE